MAEDSESPFTAVPAPWLDAKADVFFTVARASASKGLAPSSYAPLEANSTFADPDINGKFVGGVGMCMFVRYTKSPVGR